MLDLTPLLRPYFTARARRALRLHDDVERTQRGVLAWLLERARYTDFGRRHSLRRGVTPGEFAAQVPLQSYPDVRDDVMRALRGEKDVLWPGRVTRFAQSSGTTDGKSKYIPVTADSLRSNHYRGGVYSVGYHLSHCGGSHLFSGKTFILGGSFANEVSGLPRGVKVGDLSAHLIDCINPAVELMRTPSREVALMEAWEAKLPRLIDIASREDVTSISGVPSWFLTVLRGILAKAGAASIHDVWPRLEVFFHGGISFAPYRSQYQAICDPAKMHFLETYNASEGFFAVQDAPDAPGMALMIDDGIYYEFIPVTEADAASPRALPAWEVEEGGVYELVISSCNGLWRYRPGDTVRVRTTAPLRITVEGRTKQYINAFGEELMVHNAEEAMARACHDTGASVANYTAAPVYTTERAKGHHEWLVEFALAPASVEEFAAALDRHLCEVNSDYQAKRTGGIFLAPLTLRCVPAGFFDRWLATTGKLGGQRKVPRLCPDRHIIEPMLSLLADDPHKK